MSYATLEEAWGPDSPSKRRNLKEKEIGKIRKKNVR